MRIPIVRDGGKIIGWTDKVPEFRGVALRHEEAERLIGGPISCAYVQIDNRADAQRAGAPTEWNGPWRCLAICGDGAGLGLQSLNSGAVRCPQPQ